MELERVVRVLEEREEGLKILRESGLSFVFSFCVWFQSINFDFLGKHKN